MYIDTVDLQVYLSLKNSTGHVVEQPLFLYVDLTGNQSFEIPYVSPTDPFDLHVVLIQQCGGVSTDKVIAGTALIIVNGTLASLGTSCAIVNELNVYA